MYIRPRGKKVGLTHKLKYVESFLPHYPKNTFSKEFLPNVCDNPPLCSLMKMYIFYKPFLNLIREIPYQTCLAVCGKFTAFVGDPTSVQENCLLKREESS